MSLPKDFLDNIRTNPRPIIYILSKRVNTVEGIVDTLGVYEFNPTTDYFENGTHSYSIEEVRKLGTPWVKTVTDNLPIDYGDALFDPNSPVEIYFVTDDINTALAMKKSWTLQECKNIRNL